MQTSVYLTFADGAFDAPFGTRTAAAVHVEWLRDRGCYASAHECPIAVSDAVIDLLDGRYTRVTAAQFKRAVAKALAAQVAQ